MMNRFRGWWNLVNCDIAEMGKVDSMTLCRRVCKETGEHFDWHEFSSYLEHLTSVGFMKYDGQTNDGHQIYTYIPESKRQIRES